MALQVRRPLVVRQVGPAQAQAAPQLQPAVHPVLRQREQEQLRQACPP